MDYSGLFLFYYYYYLEFFSIIPFGLFWLFLFETIIVIVKIIEIIADYSFQFGLFQLLLIFGIIRIVWIILGQKHNQNNLNYKFLDL